MKTETIIWHELPADPLPDDDITVLALLLDVDGEAECWPAHRQGEHWIDCGSGGPLDSAGYQVLAWADMPVGGRPELDVAPSVTPGNDVASA